MITTGGAPLVSRSVNTRPRTKGILNTSKYPGEAVTHPPPPAGPTDGRPTISNARWPYLPSRGTQHVVPTATTPGSRLRRSSA